MTPISFEVDGDDVVVIVKVKLPVERFFSIARVVFEYASDYRSRPGKSPHKIGGPDNG